MRAWMKYWLTAVSSAQSTSCRTAMTSSWPFMDPPRLFRREGRSYRGPKVAASRGTTSVLVVGVERPGRDAGGGGGRRGRHALGGEMLAQVGKARGAEEAGAGLGLDRVEASARVAQPADEVLERQLRALAARHG